MCEAELWDEALLELKRQTYASDVKKEEAVWLAKISLGMGRYEDVVDLQKRAKKEGCDIARYLAVAYAKLGDHETAQVLAQDELHNRQQGAERTMGHVYFAAGDFERALYWYERDTGRWLQYGSGMTQVGKTLMALGAYREAALAWEHTIWLASFRRDENVKQLAECYRKIGRTRRAEELEGLIEMP